MPGQIKLSPPDRESARVEVENAVRMSMECLFDFVCFVFCLVLVWFAHACVIMYTHVHA